MDRIYPLKGIVKHYDWGGHDLIPPLCGLEKNADKSYAEYWMGIHPSGSSQILVNDQWRSLEKEPVTLSYLLKLLDVKNMLSIQVHPDKAGAIEGFERENKMGIPLDAPNRNYRDRNHKPEMMVALSDFWLLHGFKPPEQLVDVLTNVNVLNEFLPLFSEKGYEALYHHIMRLDPAELKRILSPLKNELLQAIGLNKEDEDFWAARAFRQNGKEDVYDPGIFSIYLFNLLHLKKGEGIYQGSGLPHAYLEGHNVEIMANSDNVLRGGLTSKHIDVTELLRHVKCEATYPNIQYGEQGNREFDYQAPVQDFSLRSIRIGKGEQCIESLMENSILLITEGVLQAGKVMLRPGSPAAYVEKQGEVALTASEDSLLFIASGLEGR